MDRWLCHFRGVIDGYTFPEDPVVMYRKGKHHDVPYMIGLAGDEGTGLMNILTPDNLERYAEGFGSQKEDFIAFCQQLTPSELAGGLLDGNAFRCRLFAETQLKNGMQPAYCYCTIRRAPGILPVLITGLNTRMFSRHWTGIGGTTAGVIMSFPNRCVNIGPILSGQAIRMVKV